MILKDLLVLLQSLSENKENLNKEVLIENQSGDYWKTIIYTPLKHYDVNLKGVIKSDYHSNYNGRSTNYKEFNEYYDSDKKHSILEAIILS